MGRKTQASLGVEAHYRMAASLASSVSQWLGDKAPAAHREALNFQGE